jgi:hypothetical protein
MVLADFIRLVLAYRKRVLEEERQFCIDAVLGERMLGNDLRSAGNDQIVEDCAQAIKRAGAIRAKAGEE